MIFLKMNGFYLKSRFSQWPSTLYPNFRRYIRIKLRSTKEEAEVTIYRKYCAISEFCFFQDRRFFGTMRLFQICFYRRPPRISLETKRFASIEDSRVFGTSARKNLNFQTERTFCCFQLGRKIFSRLVRIIRVLFGSVKLMTF